VSGQTSPVGLLLVGTGRMGRLIEEHAASAGCVVVGRIDDQAAADPASFRRDTWPGAQVVVDFSTAGAFVANFPKLAAMGLDVVVGTTGWQAHEPEIRRVAADAGIGVVAASNFSTGVAIFTRLVAEAARLLAAQPSYGAWLHEIHHAAKLDAPSGTAVTLRSAMERAGYPRPIDVSSSRAGFMPGTHTVGFDGPAETITLTHVARDRATFAHGALAAACWVRGRRGWFGIGDVLGLPPFPAPLSTSVPEE
jgi:4-hydroxy-tetrahydrodipicolinate reductase